MIERNVSQAPWLALALFFGLMTSLTSLTGCTEQAGCPETCEGVCICGETPCHNPENADDPLWAYCLEWDHGASDATLPDGALPPSGDGGPAADAAVPLPEACQDDSGLPAQELCNGLDDDCDGDIDEDFNVNSSCTPAGRSLNACEYGITACGDDGQLICEVHQLAGEGRRLLGDQCLSAEGTFVDLVSHRNYEVDPPNLPEGQEKPDGKVCVQGTIKWPNAEGDIVEEPLIACSPDNAYCAFNEDGWLVTGHHDLEDGMPNLERAPCYLQLMDPRIALFLQGSEHVQLLMQLSPNETCQGFHPDTDPYERQLITILHVGDDSPAVICARSDNQYEADIASGENGGIVNGEPREGQLATLLQGVGDETNNNTVRAPMRQWLRLGHSAKIFLQLLRVDFGPQAPEDERFVHEILTDVGRTPFNGPLTPNDDGIVKIGCDTPHRCVKARAHALSISGRFPEEAAALYKVSTAAAQP